MIRSERGSELLIENAYNFEQGRCTKVSGVRRAMRISRGTHAGCCGRHKLHSSYAMQFMTRP